MGSHVTKTDKKYRPNPCACGNKMLLITEEKRKCFVLCDVCGKYSAKFPQREENNATLDWNEKNPLQNAA